MVLSSQGQLAPPHRVISAAELQASAVGRRAGAIVRATKTTSHSDDGGAPQHRGAEAAAARAAVCRLRPPNVVMAELGLG